MWFPHSFTSILKPQVVLGGGQEAMDVTTTSSRIGKFDARFFHMVFEEEIGRVKGHFGPINSVTFHPDGKRFVNELKSKKYLISAAFVSQSSADESVNSDLLQLNIFN